MLPLWEQQFTVAYEVSEPRGCGVLGQRGVVAGKTWRVFHQWVLRAMLDTIV